MKMGCMRNRSPLFHCRIKKKKKKKKKIPQKKLVS